MDPSTPQPRPSWSCTRGLPWGSCPKLGSADAGLGRVLERELEDLLHPARQVERHGFAHALGHIVEVLLVAARKDNLLEAHPVSCQHLLLDAADRQHQA